MQLRIIILVCILLVIFNSSVKYSKLIYKIKYFLHLLKHILDIESGVNSYCDRKIYSGSMKPKIFYQLNVYSNRNIIILLTNSICKLSHQLSKVIVLN